MQRKILTFKNSNGLTEDLIPYVDDLAVQIDGTNLKDYLAQIEDNLEVAKLFLGAFADETSLFAKYPDGAELPVGTYAIVTDTDSLYIYDTDALRWLRTASAIMGILQLNGLSPINGSLTITGGDIKSTVSNAETQTQTITNHIDTLYAKNNSLEALKESTIADYYSYDGLVESGSSVLCKITVDAKYKDCDYIFFKIQGAPSGSTIDKTKYIVLQVTYTDGTVLKHTLYSANGKTITLNKMDSYLGVKEYSDTTAVLVKKGNSRFEAINIQINELMPINKTVALSSSNWVNNETGTGYKYVLNAPISTYTGSYNVISISKKSGTLYTTAVVDYEISGNVITIYSDSRFDGKITYIYRMG